MVSTADSPEPPNPEALVVDETLKTLTKILEELARDVDSQMGLADLQRAVDAIDRNTLGYLGEAGRGPRLDQLRTDHTLVRHAYRRSTEQMLEWSAFAASTLETLIPLLDEPVASPADQDRFWRTVAGALGTGLERAGTSLNHLQGLEATALEKQFRDMLESLRHDFGPDGVYGRRMRELKAPPADKEPPAKQTRLQPGAIETGEELSEKPLQESPPPGSLQESSCAAEGLVVGDVAEHASKGEPAGISKWCQKIGFGSNPKPKSKPKPVDQEELGRIETLQRVLTENIEDAIAFTKKLIHRLEADKRRLATLGQLNSRNQNAGTLLVAHPELRDGLVPRLKVLKRACLSYRELRCG
ncbi:uncharacterized protein Dana_GF19544 [Drosophila ananassae]|uniref:Uncharacterized protein n=1 Tax=Drosophila ananassae TaxID=7217 RepID=B3MXZ2_DROAN|nr:uncharacterized protein LOC6502300 [Drosophila ananassae]EDV38607.1 uncharacterized protein Dana_GF19544 [Drosophila ananassae]